MPWATYLCPAPTPVRARAARSESVLVRQAANKTFGRGMGQPGANPFANGFVIAAAMVLVVDSGGQLDWCPPRRPKLTTSQLSGHGRRSDKKFQKTWINIPYIFNSWGGL